MNNSIKVFCEDSHPDITEEVLEEAQNNQPVIVTLPLEVYNEQSELIRTIQSDVAFIKRQIDILKCLEQNGYKKSFVRFYF